MRRCLAALGFLAVVTPVVAADARDDAARKLNGTYQVLSVVIDGKPDNQKRDSVSSFTIKDGTFTITEGNKVADTAKFTVDPSQKPPHIDILPGRQGKVLGIYELKETDSGTELTIAWSMDERPRNFKSEGGGGIVIKLLRKKDK